MAAGWTPDEKRRAACWRLSCRGAESLKLLLNHLVDSQGSTWPDWCRAHQGIIRDRLSYPHAIRLATDPNIPDMEQMDTTYLAHILRNSTLEDSMKNHVKVVKDVRNDLCHHHTETMDETTFKATRDRLLDSFEEIVKPVMTRDERREFIDRLSACADPAAITEGEMSRYREEIEDLRRRLAEANEAGDEVVYQAIGGTFQDQNVAGVDLTNPTADDVRQMRGGRPRRVSASMTNVTFTGTSTVAGTIIRRDR